MSLNPWRVYVLIYETQAIIKAARWDFESIKHARSTQGSLAAKTAAVTIGFDVWTQNCLCVGHCVLVSGGASPHVPAGPKHFKDRLNLGLLLPANEQRLV